MVSSLCPEGSSNILNFSRVGQSMLAEQLPQQSWAKVFTFTESTPCGVHVDSSGLLLHATVSTFATSVDADVSSMPLGDTGFQNSLYSSVQVSSELLNSAGQVDPPTPSQTFVKVYKSGSVGRSLDISQFSSYNELQEKLAQMFGIEGKFEDPLRLG
ncbi:hypothetical protein CMV_020898 [Castanea mollissima]|uniref:PB1 domain-containing protein n=1 Tax=Castanea mollissima TaxID=60419 RepID=A0A8J4VD65_9ROSI|nr:hypothetical protein CMV_020898 [Castanea mollissima]